MKFLAAFLLSLTALLGPYFVLVHVIDPRGDFGTGIFPSLVMDAERDKVPLFRAFAARHREIGLVLGSSRSMKFRPSDLEAVYGVPFFNFAVQNARTESYLSIYSWITQTMPVHIRHVIIGLDVEALDNDYVETDDTRRELAGNIGGPEGIGATVTAYQRALSTSYLADVARSIRLFAPAVARATNLETLRTQVFDADGYTRYPQWEQQKKTGTFDLQKEIDGSLRAYYYRFVDMSGLSPQRQAYLELLIRKTMAEHADVIVLITPIHPQAAKYLAETNTHYAQMLNLVRAYLQDLRTRYGITIDDFSGPEQFHGTLDGWYDCCHIDEANANLIMSILGRESQHGL